MGAEETFPRDHLDADLLDQALLGQAERVARECRTEAVRTWTVTLKLRFSDFRTLTRSHTLDDLTDQAGEIYHEARRLLRQASTGQEVRLIGVSVSNLVPAREALQLHLFLSREKAERVSRAMDLVQTRFGDGAISRASLGGAGRRRGRRAN